MGTGLLQLWSLSPRGVDPPPAAFETFSTDAQPLVCVLTEVLSGFQVWLSEGSKQREYLEIVKESVLAGS